MSLHKAASANRVDDLMSAIAAGSDLDAVDRSGSTPLFSALREGHVECVRVLLEANADACKRNNFEQLPISYVAYKRDVACLQVSQGKVVVSI